METLLFEEHSSWCGVTLSSESLQIRQPSIDIESGSEDIHFGVDVLNSHVLEVPECGGHAEDVLAISESIGRVLKE